MTGFFSHTLSWFGAHGALFLCFRACCWTDYVCAGFLILNRNDYILIGIIVTLLLVFTFLVKLEALGDEIRHEEVCYEVQKEKCCTDK
jgi:hypothetical protein